MKETSPPPAGVSADGLPVPLSRRLTARHWVALDILFATFLALGSAGSVATGHAQVVRYHGAADVVRYLAIIVTCGALPLRRRNPLAVLAATVVADTVLIGMGTRSAAHVTVGFAMYTVAVGSRVGVSLPLVSAATVPLLVATVARSTGRDAGAVIFAPAVVLVGWLAGENTRSRRVYAAGLAERVAEQERERARRAAAEERARIARELHDVVAHSMSVVAVRSGVARMVMGSRPEEAAEALGIIETVSRRGLAELRRIVGVLRSPSDGAAGEPAPDDLAPAPGLDDLPALVADVNETGVRVALHVEGTAARLPAGQDLSAYRIAQEALTNVVRHAGPATVATLSVRYGTGEVVIECVDDGGGRSRPAEVGTGGHGLVGMRERVALYGGRLEAGPAGTGFRVLARLPVTEEGP